MASRKKKGTTIFEVGKSLGGIRAMDGILRASYGDNEQREVNKKHASASEAARIKKQFDERRKRASEVLVLQTLPQVPAVCYSRSGFRRHASESKEVLGQLFLDWNWSCAKCIVRKILLGLGATKRRALCLGSSLRRKGSCNSRKEHRPFISFALRMGWMA